MTHPSPEVTTEFLQALADAWNRGIRRAALAATLLLALVGCSDDGPTQPGAPAKAYVGISANPSDFNFPDSIGSAILTARATGANFMQNGELWSTLEPSPGAIDVRSVRQSLPILSAIGFATYYNLRIVDTNNRGTPGDLAATAWDDPAMIARVDAVLDSLIDVFELAPPVAFAFGNEVDVYFSAHPGELAAFRSLFQHARARVRTRLPDLPVGTCTTSPVLNAYAWVGDTLNASADLVIYTYYPFQPATDFVFRPPATLEPDMSAMLARAGSKPLGLQEVGYSSAAVCGSSQAAQAEFVRRFRTWTAAQPRSRVLFANWFLMTDWSSTTLNTLFTYYGGYSPGFAGFLGELGLRDTTGSAKPGWNAWRGL